MIKSVSNEEAFREICRKNRWKRTAQRREVYECVRANPVHPTVEEVWREVRKSLPYVSLDSVYRILDEFSETGLLRRLENCRALRYDANMDEHDHFVCSVCGRIFDFSFSDISRLAPLCSSFGTVTAVELQVRGVCRNCQAKFAKKTLI